MVPTTPTTMNTSTLSGMLGFLLFTFLVSKCSATATDNGNKSQFRSIPLIDLGAWISTPNTTTTSSSDNDASSLTEAQQEVVRQIFEACRSVGFFQITNHGLDLEQMDHAWSASREFFDLAVDEKLQHKTTNEAEYPYGYEQSEQLSKGKQLDHGSTSTSTSDDDDADDDADDAESAVVDLKETFAFGPNNPESGMPSRRWVDTPTVPTFQSALERYYEQMEGLAMILLKLFALCLEQPADFFEGKMDHHMSALRLVHYYPLLNPHSPPPTSSPVEEPSEVVRAGAHTDYGALTILNAKSAGLQVLLPPEISTNGDHQHPTTNKNRTTAHTSTWHSVPVVPGALVINLGDLMQRWTNDRWVSTLHRVVMPSTDALERRYSMAYFVNINGDTLVEALLVGGGSSENAKYPPIMAKDHLMAKHLASMGQPNDDPAHEEL